MTVFQASLLGIVQGLTEFLPISSSAHLILARAFFGWDIGQFGLAFDVACHFGTLLAILVYFRKDIVAMVRSVPDIAQGLQSSSADLLRVIVIGTLPVLVTGLLFSDVFLNSLRTVEASGVMLAFGAIVMLVAERKGLKNRTESMLTFKEGFYLGLAQAVALVPGVSRSGAVLTVGMLLGLKRDAAARFSFLLGIPAIIAAGGKASFELVGQDLSASALSLFGVGVVVSALVGYLTVNYFIHYVARYSLDLFVAYRLVLAIGILVWVMY